MVQYRAVESFFAGETFVDLADAQRRAETWCGQRAGMRIHGTTQRRPAEVFAAEEQPRLLPVPDEVYDVPIYATAKVHRDHHIEVAKALYSVPGELIGTRVEVRADRTLVQALPPRPAGQGPSPPGAGPPPHRPRRPARRARPSTRCATSTTLQRMAAAPRPRHRRLRRGGAGHPAAVDQDAPGLPLLGLVRRYGADAVDAACRRALDAEAINVGLIGRDARARHRASNTAACRHRRRQRRRFARDPAEFAVAQAIMSPARPRCHTGGQADRGHPRAEGAAAPR